MKINTECKIDIMTKLAEALEVLKGYDEIYMIKCIKLYQMN